MRNSADTVPPAAPAGLNAVAGDQQVSLSWTANTESDLAGYLVYASEDGGASWSTDTDAGTATGITITGLTNGTIYHFAVAAYDTNGNESSKSQAVSATPAPQTDTQAPAAPSGLTAEAGVGEVALSWLPNVETDLHGYKMYQSIDNGTTWDTRTDIGNVTAYTVTGLTYGQPYLFAITALDTSGNESLRSASVSATPLAPPDTTPPAAPAGLAAVPGDRQIKLSWLANSEPDLAGYQLFVSENGGNSWDSGTEVGLSTAYTVTELTYGKPYTFALTATDTAGNRSAKSAAVTAAPSTLDAEQLPSTGIVPFVQAIDFLYTGDNAVQTGVAAGAIQPERAAVLRGRVTDDAGQPLPGVKVTILGKPQFGETHTRADGQFDMAINGGGPLTVDYRLAGYMNVQRSVTAPWEEYTWLPDVVMKAYDTQVTAIDLTEQSVYQVARGSTVTDADGTRQATLLVAPGTTATMTLPDGTVQPLSAMNVRATEYTVGEKGPQAMPGELPTFVGYTYAVELSVDEAVYAGATEVRFNQPTYLYVDNFLEFPNGAVVPIGYYDRKKAAWIPSKNGRIVKVVGITNGSANLDVDGDGAADTGTKLTELSITDLERARLAELYPVGKSLWRSPVDHFTPFDCNWPYGPPKDAKQPPSDEDDSGDDDDKDDKRKDPCQEKGSIIGCEDQSLGQTIGIPGTNLVLHYASDRTPGQRERSSAELPITGDEVSDSLHSIRLEIEVQGKRIVEDLPITSNQRYLFEWDGKDGYGRSVYGRHPVDVKLTYYYVAQYYEARADWETSFGQVGAPAESFGRDRENGQISISTSYRTYVESPNNPYQEYGIAGWSLDVHHFKDKKGESQYMGYGTTQLPVQRSVVYQKTAGCLPGKCFSGIGDGKPASEAQFYYVYDIVHAPDGSLFVSDGGNNRVRRIGTDGIVTTYAGGKQSGDNGDGGPATQARVAPRNIALGPDGSLYIAELYDIRKVSSDGIITTFAGKGTGGSYNDKMKDGIPATDAYIEPFDVEVGPDGSVYFLERFSICCYPEPHSRAAIRKIGPDGIVTTIGGIGTKTTESIPLYEKKLYAQDIEFAPDGSLYILDKSGQSSGGSSYRNFIYKVGSDGIVRRVAGSLSAPGSRIDFPGGTNSWGQLDVDGPALDPYLTANRMSFAPDGTLYLSDQSFKRILRLEPSGLLSKYAGNPMSRCEELQTGNGLAYESKLGCLQYVAAGLDETVYYSSNISTTGWSIMSLHTDEVNFVSLPNYIVPSEDGQQLYVFDPNSGRHQQTKDAITGRTVQQFHYDGGGRLVSLEDAYGNTVVIERNVLGVPRAIVAPGGQRTELELDGAGQLSAVTVPGGASYEMSYDADGLLVSFTDRNGSTSEYEYDAQGLLIAAHHPSYGDLTIVREKLPLGTKVTMTRGEGEVTSYKIESLENGDIRRETAEPTGAVTVVTVKPNGYREIAYPDGTVVGKSLSPDPRWGMSSPQLAGMTIKTPQARTITMSESRTAAFASPTDPFSLTTYQETFTVNGRTTMVQYDAAQKTVTMTSAENRQVVHRLDDFGRTVRLEYPGQSVEPIEYAYDAQGKLQQIKQGVQVVNYHYDEQLRLTRLTDAENRELEYEYDAYGFVSRINLPSGKSLAMTHDAVGNLTGITAPGGNDFTMDYDETDELVSFLPEGSTEPVRWYYNLNGKHTHTTFPSGRLIANTFDPGGRLTESHDTKRSRTFEYADNTDRVHTMTTKAKASGAVEQQLQFAYDGSDVTKTVWLGKANATYDYTYDALSNVTGIHLNIPASQYTSDTAITWDKEDRVKSFGSQSFQYTGPGGILGSIQDGGFETAYQYDAYGRITHRTVSASGVPVYQMQLQYNAVGKVGQKTETTPQGTSVYTYDYDADGQLLEVRLNGNVIEAYAYDANGNRTSAAINGAPAESAVYDGQDRLITRGGVDYMFDADGFLTHRGSDSFTYGSRGELLEANVGGKTVTYSYDALGRHVARHDETGTTQYLYGLPDAIMTITAIIDPSGAVTEYYYDLSGQLTGMKREGVTYAIATDLVGTPKLVVGANGQIVKELGYDSFGNRLTDSNPGFLLPFGFAGGLEDTDTGLLRFGLRDYELASGRWTARDPILFTGGQTNLYVYVGNDPILFRDPLGLFCIGGNAYAGVGGGAKVCVNSKGQFSFCSELGFGVGGGLEFSPLEDITKRDSLGVEGTVSGAYGPGKLTGGFKTNYVFDTECAKKEGVLKVELGALKFDLLNPLESAYGQDWKDLEEKKGPIDSFKDAIKKGQLSAKVEASFKGQLCTRVR
ncbi:fibronectin type III domain-containing protein [Paenibacillus hamazuiensis]|uniref:fibronectin type III domain-containing protein n=1 Tax=Paenibacillus hamazuiensis TaxID=2936508 RepID=UPI003B8490F5